MGLHNTQTKQSNLIAHPPWAQKKNRICLLIVMAVPVDANVSLKTLKRKLWKYEDFEIVIANMWHVRTLKLSVVDGAFEFFGKDSNRLIKEISGSPRLKEIENIIVTRTSQIFRRTLCNICVIFFFFCSFLFLFKNSVENVLILFLTLDRTRKEMTIH